MPVISKVLIANRGEIAVRIARACADAKIASVAVYADPDREAVHARLADEAYALGGARAAETYLDAAKLVEVALRCGADAVHPGYGFLAENADFARAVIDAGLTWIGPPPSAIEALGNKTSARAIALQAGAPLVAGTADPVQDVEQVREFVAAHGLPVVIKAAYGGGGRGMKVVRELDEIELMYDSAIREAVAAFGRGECFVERYLDAPRHVETQCLADTHGAVVVVSTRDCTLQRRHQKLIEEAPAPFLSAEQERAIREASIHILAAAGYVGAGTCEFLVGEDGTVSFLEVNTRLQVEHPVTEEVTGIDLVREQLRIAAGEPLGYTEVATRGHSFEFRINGEDPANGFMPSPGRITRLRFPAGPGVRVDSGVVEGDTLTGAFDSMIAKIIVTGATRTQAVERARRALAETEIVGIPTVLPFHRCVLNEPAFVPADPTAPFRVHTRWIETELIDHLNTLTGEGHGAQPVEAPTERVVVEVGGKRIEVVLPAGLGLTSQRTRHGLVARRPRRSQPRATSNGTTLASPMQGTIVKVAVADGARVDEGDLVVVLEAMKMEQPLVAHRAGTVTGLVAAVGSSVSAGTAICEIVDAPGD